MKNSSPLLQSIIKSLSKPDAYPEFTNKVSVIQTYVSVIFITNQYAYKIKKPVDFGFLNFTTIDRRRFYCNEEVRLNRRLAPDIYEGVVEVRKTEKGASLCGNGEIIDYAVKMKRLPQSQMLDKLVLSNLVDISTIQKVAAVIAKFHKETPTSPAVAEYGLPHHISFNWEENFLQMSPFNNILPTSEIQNIKKHVELFMVENNSLLLKRVADGHIRECDGDIHLENICILDGKIEIFDCIEFNDRFRFCDTIADIAFLLMDLDYHGRHDLADAAFKEYQKLSGDHEAAKLVTFYKMYRAFVRGKVESFLSNDPTVLEEIREKAVIKARRYFRLARGYSMQEKLQPTLFITCGVMGSGKSRLAAELAFELGITCFNSDIIRKEMHGIEQGTKVYDPFNKGIYTNNNNKTTYLKLLKLAENQLKSGKSVIIDASFIRRSDRNTFRKLADKIGVRCITLFFECSINDQKKRLLKRIGEKSVSDGRIEIFQNQRDLFEPILPEELNCITIPFYAEAEDAVTAIYDRIRQ